MRRLSNRRAREVRDAEPGSSTKRVAPHESGPTDPLADLSDQLAVLTAKVDELTQLTQRLIEHVLDATLDV